jgi:Dolichyl-phosphate-mannose-protein mannosyltransferase
MINKVKIYCAWIFRKDWIYLIPVIAACFIAFLRFPILQNDDHLKVVKQIAVKWEWPEVDGERGSQSKHMLVHHTVAAGLYRGLEILGPIAPLGPERGVQLLSLLWGLATIPVIYLIVRHLVSDSGARVLAFLTFGTFTYWVRGAVTIDNDLAMGFWGSAALLAAIILMKRARLPEYRRVCLLGVLIGVASLMKDTASIMILPAVVSLVSRKWLYKEHLKPLLARALVLVCVWGILASMNYIRHYSDTGHLFSHDYLHNADNIQFTERWDYLSFRFPAILERPFHRNPEITDTRWNEADHSFWSKLYIIWWSLPDFLPDMPNPYATSALFFIALPVSLCGIIGLIAGVARWKKNPAWLPVVGWLAVGLAAMLLGTWLYPDMRCSALLRPRYLCYAAGSQIALLALGFEKIFGRFPHLRWIIGCIVLVQVIVFWYLLLSGPFYSFIDPVPCLTAL